MIRNILLLILALIVGGLVNMGLIITGHELFPLKESFDPMNAMSWDLTHFIFPF